MFGLYYHISMMEKKIGIDLDKTLFRCNSLVYILLNKINFNKGRKFKYKEIDPKGIYKGKTVNKVFKFLNPNKYITYIDAVKTINELHEHGYKIYFVSNRPSLKPIISLTVDSLKKFGVKYDKLVLGCNNKAEYIKQEGINYFIDDIALICNSVITRTDAKPLWFTPKIKNNREVKYTLTGFENFSTWKSIKEFFKKEIEEYKEKKENNIPEENNKKIKSA